MSLIYSDDQIQLKDSARDFLAARSPVAVQRRLRDQPQACGFDREVWEGMRELGWSAVAFTEADGGLEFGFAGFAPLFEEIGRNLAVSPLLSSVVLSGALVEQLADEEKRQQLIPQLIAGDLRLALVDGAEADGWLVTARLEQGGEAVFLIPAATPGVQVQRLQLIDSRNHVALKLDEVRLPFAARLGEDNPHEAIDLALDRGRACLAAELLGACESIFAMTVDYLKTRVQFGAPIGSFQALQHRAARLFVDLQLARSTVMAAFEALDRDAASAGERRRLVSLAKWKANEAAQKIGNEAVQMHGGIGVTDEYDLGLFLKRVRVAQACLGDSDFHCQRYAENLND
ncbi:Acyl-CoA dehydrogenase [compost metagenome]